jgi:hypothetical protein
MAAQVQSAAKAAQNSPLKPANAGLLQRQCACGQHAIGGVCEQCRKKGILQRAAAGPAPSTVPPIVHEVLRSPGQLPPVDVATRVFIEPRFAYDYSHVPLGSKSLASIQAKLIVNTPGDIYEQEADRIADRVMAASPSPAINGSQLHIQRYPGPSTEVSDSVSSSVDRVLAGSGKPLEPALGEDMGQRFGQDFSHVRVHTGGAAEQSANDVNALAYTVEHNIVFGAGQFAPWTYEGRRLLAHELMHVVQQTGTDREHVNQRNGKRGLSPNYNISKPAYLLQQGIISRNVIRRKCDVDPALDYYKTTAKGKKIDFNEWLEKMRKVAGTANKSLYDNAKAAGKIDRPFIMLVCKVQELLNIREDGKIGGTTAIAFDKFATGGEKGIDYTRLFKDKKLEVGIAIGDEFKSEFTAIVALLETEGRKLKNFSSSGSKGSRLIKFTKEFPVQGDNTAAPVAIDVEINIIGAESATPKKTYTEFLSQKEIVIYSGHARYGTGPDFDDKKSVKENFIIGVNSALHRAGKLSKGYDAHMNKILEGYSNDLEAMSKAGKIDPDKYQVWFFNACSTIHYLDEIREGLVTGKSGKIKPKANLRFMGTKKSIYSDAIEIVDSILKMKTMDQIINIMDVKERALAKAHGEETKGGYYLSD